MISGQTLMLLAFAGTFALASCEETAEDRGGGAVRGASKADGAYIDGRANALEDEGNRSAAERTERRTAGTADEIAPGGQ